MTKFTIIGLGNPGKAYLRTRHNLGQWLLNLFAEENHLSFRTRKKFNAHTSSFDLRDRSILLVKPLNFMNDSGCNLVPLMRDSGFSESEVLILHDELTLPLGDFKISCNMGSGGHKGVQSVIRSIGKTARRLRLGIGPKVISEQLLADYVLSKFTQEETTLLEGRAGLFLRAVNSVILDGVDRAMNLFNNEKNHKPNEQE